jgi:glyoxylase-like metal-dependent hydrolase (beta-lactamase superfamily II)
MEVLKGIHRIEVPYQNRYLYQHLLIGDDKIIFIDAGIYNTPDEVLIPYLERNKLDKGQDKYLIITHCDADHCGGSKSLKEIYSDIVVMSHIIERPYIEDSKLNLSYRYGEFEHIGVKRSPEKYNEIYHNLGQGVPVDISLTGDEEIRLSSDWHIRIVFSPGHTAGHIFVYDQKNNCAIITDALLGDGIYSRTGEIMLCPTYRYTEEYLYTLDVVSDLNVDVLYTSHFPEIKGREKIKQFLAKSKSYVDSVESYIVEKLNQYGEVTLKGLIEESGERLGPESRKVDKYYCLQGGLERLRKKEKVMLRESIEKQTWVKT